MSSIYSTDRPASRITDGVVEGDQDHLYAHTEAGAQWVEVNLNGIYEIDSVDLYRYSLDGRTYNDTIVLLSPDNKFDPDKTLVLFNSCQNPSIEWCVKENYKVVDFSQMAAASDSDYAEEPGGKTFKVGTSLKMLDGTEVTEENLANGRFKASYVRGYSNGHGGDSANNNHFIEIEVNAVKNNE